MSNQHLPAELLDLIVGLLYDSTDALKSCCLVSKSWIPRAQKHLFASIKISTPRVLQSWKTVFPDPSTSPARYTKALFIRYSPKVAVAAREEGSWISTFAHVVRFELDTLDMIDANWSGFNLAQFHGFSPAIKSLRLSFYSVPSSRVFDLINSFPLLDDLAVTSYDEWVGNNDAPEDQTTAIRSLISPPFTGSLELDLWAGMDLMASRLLSLPGGLHFRRLSLTLNQREDALPMTALVEGCRSTVESLEIGCIISDLPQCSMDLSKATQLKDVAFLCKLTPRRIVVTLRTITLDHRNLQRVSVSVPEILYRPNFVSADPADIMRAIGEHIHLEWLNLDKLLTQLWESRSIRPEVMFDVPSSMGGEGARSVVESLLPELTTRGLVELRERQ